MNRTPTAMTPQYFASNDELGRLAEPTTEIRSETIILETRDFELEAGDPTPTKVVEKLALRNFVRRITLELALFGEHYVLFREKRRKGRTRSMLINLRYLDSRPELSRRLAEGTLRISLGLLFGALVAGSFGLLVAFPVFNLFLALGLTAASGAMFWVYATRTTETVVFRTAEGRAPTLILRANVGCIRACRSLVPSVVEAVKAARQTVAPETDAYLKKAMREHYRLQEIGVLSAETCSAGTMRILSAFDAKRLSQR